MKKRSYIGTKRDITGHVPSRPDPNRIPPLTRDRIGDKCRLAFTPDVPVGYEGQGNPSRVEKKPRPALKMPKLSADARRSLAMLGLKS